MLLRIAHCAGDQHQKAWICLIRGDWEIALHHAAESWALKQDSQAAGIACLAAVAHGDIETAKEWLVRHGAQ